MPQGDFADNLSSYLQGATNEIFRRREEQRQIKQQQEDAALKMKLNLFGSMMNDPEKYSDEHIRTFSNLIDKDHKISDLFGQNVQDMISPLLEGRHQWINSMQQNPNLTEMLGQDLSQYSPQEIKAHLPGLYSSLVGSQQKEAQRQMELEKLALTQRALDERERIKYENAAQENERNRQSRIEEAKIGAKSREEAAKITGESRIKARSIPTTARDKTQQDTLKTIQDLHKQAGIAAGKELAANPYGGMNIADRTNEIFKTYVIGMYGEDFFNANFPDLAKKVSAPKRGTIPPEVIKQLLGTTTTTTLPPHQESTDYTVTPNR